MSVTPAYSQWHPLTLWQSYVNIDHWNTISNKLHDIQMPNNLHTFPPLSNTLLRNIQALEISQNGWKTSWIHEVGTETNSVGWIFHFPTSCFLSNTQPTRTSAEEPRNSRPACLDLNFQDPGQRRDLVQFRGFQHVFAIQSQRYEQRMASVFISTFLLLCWVYPAV